MNVALITGRLTKDIDLRYVGDNANCLFTLAVDRGFKDEQGNKQTDFISCVAWNKQAEFLHKYTKKGDRVGVKGRIQTRNYQAQDGSTRFITEIVVDTVESYESKPQEQEQQPKSNVRVNGKPYNPQVDDDDTIPF